MLLFKTESSTLTMSKSEAVCSRLSLAFSVSNEKLQYIASHIKPGLFMQQLSILLQFADIHKPFHDYTL